MALDDSAAVPRNSINFEIDVLLNDSDIDGDPVTVESVTAPVNGTAAVGAGGAFVYYTPPQGFIGTDTFTYTAIDGHAAGFDL